MKNKSVVKRLGNSIALTVALVSMLIAYSCKKEIVRPESTPQKTSEHLLLDTIHQDFKPSLPVLLNGAHDMTISGDLINGGTLACINLANCFNIHITNCRLLNSNLPGISLTKCSNILIDNSYVGNVSVGIYAINSNNINVKNNRFKTWQQPKQALFWCSLIMPE